MKSLKIEEKIDQVLAELAKYEVLAKNERFKKIAEQDNETKNALVYNFSPKSGFISLVPLYDVHYGLKSSNEDLLDLYLEYILDTDDCYTFLGGDSCEVATKDSIGRATYDELMHLGEQRRILTDKLRPLAKSGKILGGICGNHESRLSRYADDDPMEEICYDLGIPYCGYSAFLNINVNSINYHVMFHHGTGTGTTPGGAANSAAKAGKVAVADLYFSGHTHKRMSYDEAICEIIDNKVVKRRRLFVVGGSLVNYFDMYAEEKLLTPSVVGLVKVTLDGTIKNMSATI